MRKKNRFIVICFVSMLFSFICSESATGTIELKGRVIDKEGGGVVGAKVILINEKKEIIDKDLTSLEGVFQLHALPGIYQLSVFQFRKASDKDITIPEGVNSVFQEVSLKGEQYWLWEQSLKLFPSFLTTVFSVALGLMAAWFKLWREREKSIIVFTKHLYKPLQDRCVLLKSFIGRWQQNPGKAFENKDLVSEEFLRSVSEIYTLMNIMESSYGPLFVGTLPDRFARVLEIKMVINKLKVFGYDPNIAWVTEDNTIQKLNKLLEDFDRLVTNLEKK